MIEEGKNFIMNSFVKPLSPRHMIKNLEASLEITIASSNISTNSLKKIILGIFLILWILLGFFITKIFIDITSLDHVFPFPKLVYLIPIEWLLGSIFIGVMLFWAFTFKEVIIVSNDDIVIKKQSRVFNSSSRYLAEHIKDLRASTTHLNHSIAFDYGARTIRLGYGLDEAEAKQIVVAIQKRFPFYSE